MIWFIAGSFPILWVLTFFLVRQHDILLGATKSPFFLRYWILRSAHFGADVAFGAYIAARFLGWL